MVSWFIHFSEIGSWWHLAGTAWMTDSIKIHVNEAFCYSSGTTWLPLLFLPKYWICAKVHVACASSLDVWFGHDKMYTRVFLKQHKAMWYICYVSMSTSFCCFSFRLLWTGVWRCWQLLYSTWLMAWFFFLITGCSVENIDWGLMVQTSLDSPDLKEGWELQVPPHITLIAIGILLSVLSCSWPGCMTSGKGSNFYGLVSLSTEWRNCMRPSLMIWWFVVNWYITHKKRLSRWKLPGTDSFEH